MGFVWLNGVDAPNRDGPFAVQKKCSDFALNHLALLHLLKAMSICVYGRVFWRLCLVAYRFELMRC
jgi:hypothetical protein